MTDFINQIEPLGSDEREAGNPRTNAHSSSTFGHPEIAAAGRTDEIQQDPRPAIYFNPFLDAVNKVKSN